MIGAGEGIGHVDREAVGTANLLDVAPSLGEGLSDEERAQARSDLVAKTVWLDRTEWLEELDDPELFGLVVLEGALVRRAVVGRGRMIEVLVEGDVARPAQADTASFVESDFFALKESRVAVLDHDFASAICRWPALTRAIVERTVRRAHANAGQAAIRSYTGIERRILFSFWHLAERCGVETKDGIAVPLPLTHQLIADLVGAHRPAVTSALGRLADSGTLARSDGTGWLLDPESRERLPVRE